MTKRRALLLAPVILLLIAIGLSFQRAADNGRSPVSIEGVPPAPTMDGAPPGAVDPIDLDAALAECERRVRQAEVTFPKTLKMEVGRVDSVTVKASISGDPAVLDHVTDTTIARLPVTCHLQARLRGLKFDVDPPDFRTQSFLHQSTATWTWDVKPTHEGELVLTAEVQSIVRDKTDVIAAAGSIINVDAADRSLPETVNAAAVAFVTHPVVQFFGATAVLGALAYLWRRVRDRQGPSLTLR
jgi:hypothetical protein